MAKLINNNNLQDKDFTNAEVLALLEKIATNCDGSGASRIYDAIEDLTGNRNFENSEVDQAGKDLVLKVAKAGALDS